MEEKFNKTIMFDNISYMLKEVGKKIGELESEAGVSPGYISRTSKEGNTKPGIDFIMRAAESLNVSLDTLLRVDMTSLTPTEKYLTTFLQKLVKDTLEDKLDWQTETPGYLNSRLEADIDGGCAHPLFCMERFQGDPSCPDNVMRLVFCSRSFDVYTDIDGECYNLRMKNGAKLYIMKISKSGFQKGDSDVHAIEIWMCPVSGDNQFLCSTKDTEKIADLIRNLYGIVNEQSKHPKISRDVKEIIDAFINDSVEQEDDSDSVVFTF